MKTDHAKYRYSEFLNADYGFPFSDWLGIRLPELETRYDFRNGHLYRYRRGYGYDAIIGTWEKTQKAAKATYKVALSEHRKQMKILLSEEG